MSLPAVCMKLDTDAWSRPSMNEHHGPGVAQSARASIESSSAAVSSSFKAVIGCLPNLYLARYWKGEKVWSGYDEMYSWAGAGLRGFCWTGRWDGLVCVSGQVVQVMVIQ